MNAYEAKQEARRERLEDRSHKLTIEAGDLYGRARSMADIIPFGQPILVGHHSEGRDRNYRGRIHGTFAKAFAAQNKAQELARRAESVGSGGISSDDQDAITKLRDKIATLEALQERMKTANKAVKKKDRVALAKQDFTEEQIDGLFTPDFCGRVGFASFEITNNGANIRRMKERIEHLEALAVKVVMEPLEGDGWSITEDAEDNRIVIRFDEKPSKEVLAQLRSSAFKWSPTRKAHIRMRSDYAIHLAKEIVGTK
jgi:hypothetical protein